MGRCELISRRGNVYRAFGPLCRSLSTLGSEAVLDGEVVMLDNTGRSQFYELLRRRGNPVYYAFNCVWLNGRDLRSLPLMERRRTWCAADPWPPQRPLRQSH
jgi:bifunctional non-homologous end joining protein LigD